MISLTILSTALATGAAVLTSVLMKKLKEQSEAAYQEEAEEEEELIDDAVDEVEDADEEAPEGEVTLEKYIAANPEEEESLNAVKDSFSADGVRTDISCTGNTMFFDFIMTDVDDEDVAASLKPDLDTFLEDQSESYAEIVKTIEDETGVDDIKMIVIFMDANEEEIVSGHYDDNGKVL